MADEQASPVAPAAPTAVSSPLSSPAPAPSASPASPAPAAASPPTPSSAAGTTTEIAATRPEGLPDSYWDAEKNSLKVDPAALVKDLKERDELKTFKAAEDVKALSRPQKADDYKLELPSDFKPPAGVEFKLDTANPSLGQLKSIAHKHGLTQDAVNDILGVYAGNEVGTEARIATARQAEITKLGPSAPARVDAVTQWLAGIDASADKGDAKALAGMLVTARHVEAFERIINRLTTQGTAGFSQSHRVAPDDGGIPGYDKMSFAERRFAQDQLAARRRTA